MQIESSELSKENKNPNNPIRSAGKNEAMPVAVLPLSTRLGVYFGMFQVQRDLSEDTSELLNILMECTSELLNEEGLKNNRDFVLMWLQYIELDQTPNKWFLYLESNRIGELVAEFWIEWSKVALLFNDFKYSESILQLGIQKRAEPFDLIQQCLTNLINQRKSVEIIPSEKSQRVLSSSRKTSGLRSASESKSHSGHLRSAGSINIPRLKIEPYKVDANIAHDIESSRELKEIGEKYKLAMAPTTSNDRINSGFNSEMLYKPESGLDEDKRSSIDLLDAFIKDIAKSSTSVGGQFVFKVNGQVQENYWDHNTFNSLNKMNSREAASLALSDHSNIKYSNLGEVERHMVVFDEAKLHKSSESVYQNWAENNESNEYIKFTDSSNLNTPIFKHHKEGKFLWNANADAVSMSRPMVIEIKGKRHKRDANTDKDCTNIIFDILKQTIERVYCMAIMQQHFGKCHGFGIANGKVFMIMFERKWMKGHRCPLGLRQIDKLVESFDVVRINPISFGILWGILSLEATKNPDCIYVDAYDAAVLNNFIHSLTDGRWGKTEHLLCYCRVCLEGVSSNRVYSVTLPQYIMKYSCLGVSKNEKHFAVKIIPRQKEFENECQCVMQILANETVAKDFHVFGVLIAKDSSSYARHPYVQNIVKELSNERLSFLQDRMESAAWWQRSPREPVSCGGAIVMRMGSNIHQNISLDQLCGELHESLEKIHECGVLQCDLRKANIKPFEVNLKEFKFEVPREWKEESSELVTKWQIIDFGMGKLISDPTPRQIAFKSGQYINAGYKVQRAGDAVTDGAEEFSYQWSIHDDYEMLNKLVLRLI